MEFAIAIAANWELCIFLIGRQQHENCELFFPLNNHIAAHETNKTEN